MEKILERIERKEELGRDVMIVVDLIRHGEKDGPDGLLTEEGEREARRLGKKIKDEFPDSAGVKAYHSGVPRARQTAEAVAQGGSFSVRRKAGLTLHGHITKETVETFESKVKDAGNEGSAVQWYLDTDAERPDSGTLSSREASAEIAREIKHLIDMSVNFKPHSKLNIVLVSHSGVIEHFIADALSAERKGFIEKIGGGVRYLEGARLVIHRIDKDNFEMRFEFRGNEAIITPEQLEKISQAGEEMVKKQRRG